MYLSTEAIVLKQTKTVGGRRMISLFSKDRGKISCGTSINEGGKNKAALALRPFSRGRYELYKNGDNYNISGAEIIKSSFSLGEDVDKYMAASYMLELTDNLLQEGQISIPLYKLCCTGFELLEKRKKAYNTLVAAFMLKALSDFGVAPYLEKCIVCGENEPEYLDVAKGGFVCGKCVKTVSPLLFPVKIDIIQILRFIASHPLRDLENLGLSGENEKAVIQMLKAYYKYHLGIAHLKSESFML